MSQVIIRINHTALIAAVLTFCSVAKEQHGFVLKYLYKLCVSCLFDNNYT